MARRWPREDGTPGPEHRPTLTEVSVALGLPASEPAEAGRIACCFERHVALRHGDGSQSYGDIDLYRRGAFVLEAKDVKVPAHGGPPDRHAALASPS